MDYNNLSDQEIKALLMQYDSEMRKLSFQMQVIQSTIHKLHESLNTKNTEIQISAPVFSKEENQSELNNLPKPISGVEYPKKRNPNVEISALSSSENKVLKKPGSKPKSKNVEPKVPMKRGPKPKLKIDPEIIKERKKPGPKPKNSALVVDTTVRERKKPGPKPKLKDQNAGIFRELKKRGRKSKSELTNSADISNPGKVKKKLRSKQNTKRKYTKENPWPEFIINTLHKYGHLMNSAQLYELAEEENTIRKYGLEQKEVRSMISRAFHQLSNNKKSIVKFDIKGSKSYNYGLTGWVNSNGDISEQYLP